MKRKIKTHSNNDSLFDLALFFLTSARAFIDDPKEYGVIRFLDAFSALMDMINNEGKIGSDVFLNDVAAELDANKIMIVSSGNKNFSVFLDNLIMRCVDEMIRRSNLAGH